MSNGLKMTDYMYPMNGASPNPNFGESIFTTYQNNFRYNTPPAQYSMPQSPNLAPSPLLQYQKTSIPSPCSPQRLNNSQLYNKRVYSPNRLCSPRSNVTSSPNLSRKTSLSHMDQRDDNFPKHQRRRSQSCLYYKTPVKDGLIVPVANSNNIQFPPPVPIRMRSHSLDTSHRSSRYSRPSCYSLQVQYKNERKEINFSGTTLEELQSMINSCYLFLPLVRVCIEHPSIPNQLVSITDLDQLYDNAVIHLLPLDN